MAIKNFFCGGKQILTDAALAPLAGGLCYFYEPGTTTPKNTYTTPALSVANANPVVLDAAGRANIWLNGNYRVIVRTSLSVTVYDEDNINPEESIGVTAISGDTTLVRADDGEFFEVTGTTTITLTSASTLGAGWTAWIKNVGSNTVTIARANSGNSINGTVANITLPPGLGALFVVNDAESGFFTLGHAHVSADQTWTGTNTFTGSTTISGTTVLSGATTAISGTTTLSGPTTISNNLNITGDVDVGGVELTAGQAIVCNAAATGVVGWAPGGHIFGLAISNNGSDANNDIDVAVGECTDDTEAYVMKLTSGLTKRLDANWAVGTNQGGLDTGSENSSTWYHFWIIMRPDTGVVDALFSASATSPTMPANYTVKRRIGAVRNNASSNLLAFAQVDDEFILSIPVNDVSTAATDTAAAVTLTVPPSTEALFRASLNAIVLGASEEVETVFYGAGSGTLTPSVTTGLASLSFGSSTDGITRCTSGHFRLRTSATSQINHDSTVGSSAWTIDISTYGWIDTRGRFA